MADPLADVKRAYREYRTQARRAMAAATNEAAALLLAEMRALTSAVGPTLADLRRLDHPYAARHSPGTGPTADWIAHTASGDDGRSGELLGGLRRTRAKASGSVVTAEIHSASAHTWAMLQGSPRMRPRDFVSAALISRAPDVAVAYERAFARLVADYRDGFRTLVTLVENEHGRSADLPEA